MYAEVSSRVPGRVYTDVRSSTDEVLRKLGAGAAGAVYSARDRASGLVVAVKILGDPTEKRANPVAKEELMYERLVRHGSPAIK